MNRQLKFRAWDNTKLEWIDVRECSYTDLFEDEKYIVQQWTGEYDKNRKPIYEGDIISSYSAEFINENFEAEIVFIDAGFYAKVNEKDYRGVWSGKDIEVMGNIFQLTCNPDHNGECLVCDNWVCDCPFNKEKAQDDLQKLVKKDPMWQKPLSIADPKQ